MKNITAMLDDFIASRRKRLRRTIGYLSNNGGRRGRGSKRDGLVPLPALPDALLPEDLSVKNMAIYRERVKAYFAPRILPKLFAAIEHGLEHGEKTAVAEAGEIYNCKPGKHSGVNVNNFNLPPGGRMVWSMEAAARKLVENHQQIPAAKVIDIKAEPVNDA